MDDVQVMRFLARSLEQAASQHDWLKMQEVDAQVAALMTTLQGQTLPAEKSDAVAALQRVYQQVSQYCQQQSDALEQKMAQARSQQEGALAYAQFAPQEDMGR
jgi:hypothetical protein